MNIKSWCLAGTLLLSIGGSTESAHLNVAEEYQNNTGNADEESAHLNVAEGHHNNIVVPNDHFIQNVSNQTAQNNMQQQNLNAIDYEPDLIEVPIADGQNDLAHHQQANLGQFPAQIVNGDLHIISNLNQMLGSNEYGYLATVVSDITNPNTSAQNGNATAIAYVPNPITVPIANTQPNNNDPAHAAQANATDASGQNTNNNQQENYAIDNLANDITQMSL